MKHALFAFFIVLSSLAYCQDFEFESRYKNFVSANAQAKMHKLKSIALYDYKTEESTKGDFVFLCKFDTGGRIVSQRSLNNKTRNFEETEFTYNEAGQLVKIFCQLEVANDIVDITEVTYNASGAVKTMMHAMGPSKQLVFDVMHYEYREDGKLDYKHTLLRIYSCTRSDTIFYHYTTGGQFSYASKKPTDNKNYILNENGCLLQSYHSPGDHGGSMRGRTTMQRDSLCRIVHRTEEKKEKGEWQLVSESSNTFSGNKRTEEIVKELPQTLGLSYKGELETVLHKKYEFNENGQILKVLHLNKKGELKKVEKYTYTSY
ncbi:MAG: hypothetical protein K0S33_4212 [Bacteroidetes bacterium]|jgi:flagellin-specific chaperone FliS|nr:hypothetical protein [Bacteroidota bacterium]